MNHSYTVFWKELNADGEQDPGWYCQVSSFMPWGPFDSQAEALESMLMEWPRFENILNSGCKTTCSPEDCGGCDSSGCCNI